MSNQQIGALGERIAKAKLTALGCKVLYTNFRGPKGGEIDIVARDGDTLTFVEVKTRRKRNTGSRPLDAVNAAKQALIMRGAYAWLNLLPNSDVVWRFDVVEVILEEGALPSICIVEEAFTSSGSAE